MRLNMHIFWLGTLLTSFGWFSDSTRWFTESKEGSIILLGSEDSLIGNKGTVCPTIFRNSSQPGI